jgi:hypothetical protein
MSDKTRCPDCGADWSDGQTCTDHFHMMAYWELEYLLYDVHHLMVACYHMQHPHLYSPETLEAMKTMLVQFVEHGVTPQQMRAQIREQVDSGVRKHKITGTPEHHGRYAHSIVWTMTAADVVAAGIDKYYESVWAWAHSMIAALREAGEIATK